MLGAGTGAGARGRGIRGPMSSPARFWPGDARLAVTVSMQFEAGGQPISGAPGPVTEPISPGYRAAPGGAERPPG